MSSYRRLFQHVRRNVTAAAGGAAEGGAAEGSGDTVAKLRQEVEKYFVSYKGAIGVGAAIVTINLWGGKMMLNNFRGEVLEKMGKMEGEMGQVKGEMGQVKGEMVKLEAKVDSGLSEMRGELRGSLGEMKGSLAQMAEALKTKGK